MPQNNYYRVHAFGQPYVYYQSLLDAQPHSYQNEYGTYQQSEKAHSLMNVTGRTAQTYLTARQLFDRRSATSGKDRVDKALDFLKNAATGQLIQEKRLLQSVLKDTENERIKKMLESFDSDSFDYMEFIAQLNFFLKGYEETSQIVQKEIDRIRTYKKRLKDYKEDLKAFIDKEKRNPTKQENGFLRIKAGLTSDVVYTTQGQINSNSTAEMIFKSITKANNHAKNIVNTVVARYGGKILNFNKKGQLELDPKRSIVLIKLISSKLYEIIIRQIKDNKTSKRTKLKEDVILNRKELQELDEYVEELFQTSNLGPTLDSLAQQYGLTKINKEPIKGKSSKIKRLNELIDLAYKDYLKTTKAPKTQSEWKNNLGIKDDILEQIMSSIEALSIQLHYESEGNVAMELAQNLDGGEARAIGTKGLATDVLAGYLVVDVETNEQKAKEEIRAKLEDAQKRTNDKMRKAYKKISNDGSNDSLLKSAATLTKANEEQEQILLELQDSLEKETNTVAKIQKLFNIHTSVKDYATIGSKTKQFSGVSLGANLDQQLNKINMLATSSIGSAAPDIMWLKNSIINTAAGLIGEGMKPALEEYLSLFVGFLMFDDVEQELALNINDIINNNTLVDSIHLYNLNGVYVPQSYVLSELYKAISESWQKTNQLGHSNQVMMNAHIQSSYKVKDNFFTGELDPGEWDVEGKAAIENTKIVMEFMGNFTDFLNKLNDQINLKTL